MYCGVETEKRAASGVGIFLRKELKTRILGYSWVNNRIVTLKLGTGRSHCYIVGVYSPVEGKSKETEEFYRQLHDTINKAGESDYVIIVGDMNARIGNLTVPKLTGPYDETVINANGRQLRDFCAYNNLRVTNTLYRHKEIHRYPLTERGTRSIIDFIIAN
jgi:hypothetical protein